MAAASVLRVDDSDAVIDWRLVSWGGVLMDDRPLGDENPCPRGCIPALDDPPLVPADQGGWYHDDAIVFGVTEGDEAVAFPKHVMQVHEMVNISIGGRRFGVPYCTLCGSAQAFYTDAVPDGVGTPVLRTSGLLSRSSKVMYDLLTRSAFDTFTGEAVSGALLDAGVVLEQNSVVELGGVKLRADSGGFLAFVDGEEIASHEAFWFAWSQFHPGTALWPEGA